MSGRVVFPQIVVVFPDLTRMMEAGCYHAGINSELMISSLV